MYKYGIIPPTDFASEPGATNFGNYFKLTAAEECADAIMNLVTSNCRVSKKKQLLLGNKIRWMLKEAMGETYGK